MKIERETYGIWVGVASENFPLGTDTRPTIIRESVGHLWYFKPGGEFGQNFGTADGRRRGQEGDFRLRDGVTFRLRLDCTEGSLALHCQKRDDPGVFEPVATVKVRDPQPLLQHDLHFILT